MCCSCVYLYIKTYVFGTRRHSPLLDLYRNVMTLNVGCLSHLTMAIIPKAKNVYFFCYYIHHTNLSLIKYFDVCWCEFLKDCIECMSNEFESCVVQVNWTKCVLLLLISSVLENRKKIMLFDTIQKNTCLLICFFFVSDPNYITMNQVKCDPIFISNFFSSCCYMRTRQLNKALINDRL